MKTRNKLICVLLCCVVSSSLTNFAKADVVEDWNDVLLDALVVGAPGKPGPTWASRNLAMVHGAIYDAVNSFDHQYAHYRVNLNAPAGASIDAAAAQAAHDVLAHLYPAQQANFTTALNSTLANVPNGQGENDGRTFGSTVAAAIIADRPDDHAGAPHTYTPQLTPGTWRPMPTNTPGLGLPGSDLFNNFPALSPEWGGVTPFVLQSSSQFRSVAPPALNSPEYAAAYTEVKTKGAKTGSTRTADETEIGVFWGYDRPGMGTPPRLYNEIARQIADLKNNTLIENARLFALINLAQGDAGIASWETKYHYDLWRPITAIREGVLDPDPLWQPLGAPGGGVFDDFTPPFPAYVSGHATFGAAVFDMLANFYGTDDLIALLGAPLVVPSEELPGVTRPYDSFSDMSIENGRSRIFLGIHWSFDDIMGRLQGGQIADYIFANALQPIPEPGTLLLMASGLALMALRLKRRPK